ncbi:2-C-methyl-D-erythritol 4-phosphate cytidylyltransferase [Deinococcus koreensis]|uniref:2-C-methyl-D-erythritol 4-phosphate cytidylyltransferase n=1 Tax=Deinococcus koreensis TaxID=2054903 RepID=A0A2K3UWT1_9DEIO|nr:2-C-methyl-D-erythritol 4-phosphate cytidylyltransferase [Deinococcus koreensis]PNY80985.1 2-C-methyl-D-erythritol 4-phosphate cytidylyltransferase [Deinococcus koreensis]
MSGACLLAGTVAALIPAAGAGTRLGHGPKALYTLAGRTLLERSIGALRPHVDEVVVALPEGRGDEFQAAPDPQVRFIAGGETRQLSVRRLLHATTADYVLIHDAARPFLGARIIHDLLEAVAETGAATVARPVADTLVRGGAAGTGSLWGELVAREGLWAVQTPQAFRRELLLAAHDRAHAEGHAATDDAGLIARSGGQVRLVRGDARLFKITTPDDLPLAQALAAVWDAEPDA